MGSSQADKAASHDRIVTAASARVRRDGIDAITVADLMRDAGLTHGGFYRHFESVDALIAAAVQSALEDGSRKVEELAEIGGSRALRLIVDAYLSEWHRDNPETGCAVASLPSDVTRANAEARSAYTAQVNKYLDLLGHLSSDQGGGPVGPPTEASGPSDDEATLILAAIVGGLALSRAVDDPTLSDQILERTARALRGRLQSGSESRTQRS